MAAQPVLLAVLAHPDDETFGMGGTLAYYSQQGVAVHLVCATRGELGDVEPILMEGFQSVADLREHELSCAVNHLGVTGLHFLDYRDSGMAGSPDNLHPQALAAAPLEKITAEVTHLIRKLQPQIVVTFDPIGGYRHPDHIKIHQATVAAFFAASQPELYPDGLAAYTPQKLFFNTISNAFLRKSVKLLKLLGSDPKHYGKNHDIDLESLVQVSFPIHARIHYQSVKKQVVRATACHSSQGGLKRSRSLFWRIQLLLSPQDNFMQAYPLPDEQHISTDLFENVQW